MSGWSKSEAIARIQQGLGFRTDLSTEILAALRAAQDELELGMSLPWFLKAEDVSMSGTGGDGTLSLPTGFIRVIEDENFYVTTTGGARRYLKRVAYDWLVGYLQEWADESDDATVDTRTGDPRYYAVRKTTIEVAPIPAAAFTVYANYYKQDDDLSAVTENGWLTNAPKVLVGKAGLALARDLRDADAITAFTAMFNEGNAMLIRRMAEDEIAGGEISMGMEA